MGIEIFVMRIWSESCRAAVCPGAGEAGGGGGGVEGVIGQQSQTFQPSYFILIIVITTIRL